MSKTRFVLFSLIVLAFVLSACGPSTAFEVGSVLICPKIYNPGTSVCTVKQTAEEVITDLSNNQAYEAVRLGVDEVGIYRKNSEEYGVYDVVGYHPTPKEFVRVYPKNQQSLISDIDPNACGGAHNDVNCVKALGNVQLMGFQKFSSSYVLDYSFNFETQNLKAFYEVGGRDQLMKLFNDRSRDTFRDSKDIDPAKIISQEIGKTDVAKNWLNKLSTSEYMTSWQYINLFTFKDLSVRYFEPERTDGSDGTGSSSQVLEDQKFNAFLARKDAFCAQYTPGTSLRAECDRTFVCSEKEQACYFNGSIIPVDQITPTVSPETVLPEATPTQP